MKKFLLLAAAAFVAPAAFAQVVNGPAIYPGNGIVYNLNPMPPIVSNYGTQYALGTAYLDARGRPRVCSGYIDVTTSNGAVRAACRPLAAPAPSSAAALANMAPAAGPVGSAERNLRSDSNLRSDRTSGLRTDKAFLR
jgi:hypothetical protein